MRIPWFGVVLALTTLAAPLAQASDDDGPVTYEEASHLRGGTWLLWSPYHDARALEINVETGRLREIDISGFTYPWRFLPVPDGESRAWLYGLDRRGDDEVALARMRWEGGGGTEVVRVYRGQGPGRVEAFLRRGPQSTLILAVERDGGWMVDVLDGSSGAVVQQVGPLTSVPRDLIPWSRGRWLVLDSNRLFTWPDDVTLFYSDSAAPSRWSDPPPMLPWGWPGSLLSLGGERLLCGSTFGLFEIGGEREGMIVKSGHGLRYPADGPTEAAAVQFLGRPQWNDDRLFLWDKGGQRLLRLLVPEADGPWRFQQYWELPLPAPDIPADDAALHAALHPPPGTGWLVGVRPELDRVGEYVAAGVDPAPARDLLRSEHYQRWESRVLAATLLAARGEALPERPPPPPPTTVDEVLEGWAPEAWVDLEGTSPAAFLNRNRADVAVLDAHRAEAIPRLLESRTPRAALALALLRAPEADGWFRELAVDPEPYGWESGCTYPRSSVGIYALEHLHGLPLSELIQLKRKELKALRASVEAADQLEGMDRWCGEGGFARHLLGELGEE